MTTLAAPRTPVATSDSLGWEVEKSGPLPQPKGRGRMIDSALFAAVCTLGKPPERIRLDPKKFKPAAVKKIIAAASATADAPSFTFFKAADGHIILHRLADSSQPQPGASMVKPPQPATKPAGPFPSDAAILAALDRQCTKPDQSIPIVELPFPQMNDSAGRQAAADVARDSGRYTVRAEFVQGHSGRTLVATRMR